jgi:Ca2+-binding RTX toxin-like protein
MLNWTISLAGGTALDNAGTLETIAGIEAIMGSLGNDSITGDAGANTLNGSTGNDTIIGGAGVDTMTGGAGMDIFRFNSLTESLDATPDVITDFAIAIDKLSLSGLGLTSFDTDGGNTEAGELRLAYSISTDRTYLRSDQLNFEVYLQGDYRTTLTDGDVFW